MLNMKYGIDVTEQFQRELLAELLAQLSDAQRDVHLRMYPHGVETGKLAWAITQANNTLEKNRSSETVSPPISGG